MKAPFVKEVMTRVRANSTCDLPSWLFVPGDRAEELLPKAGTSSAHVLILDLEDSVLAESKLMARRSVRRALRATPLRQPAAIRINAVGTPWWAADLDMALKARAMAIMIPKAVPAALRQVTTMIQGITGAQQAPILIPLIETAAGVLGSEAMSTAPLVGAIALGGEDLAADLGVVRTDSGMELQHARGHLALVCAAAGSGAIDTPVLSPRDSAIVRSRAENARCLGFTGMLAIHPEQANVINDVFAVTAAEDEWAREVIESHTDAAARGSGVSTLDGRMIDEPVVAMARRILERSARG